MWIEHTQLNLMSQKSPLSKFYSLSKCHDKTYKFVKTKARLANFTFPPKSPNRSSRIRKIRDHKRQGEEIDKKGCKPIRKDKTRWCASLLIKKQTAIKHCFSEKNCTRKISLHVFPQKEKLKSARWVQRGR